MDIEDLDSFDFDINCFPQNNYSVVEPLGHQPQRNYSLLNSMHPDDKEQFKKWFRLWDRINHRTKYTKKWDISVKKCVQHLTKFVQNLKNKADKGPNLNNIYRTRFGAVYAFMRMYFIEMTRTTDEIMNIIMKHDNGILYDILLKN